MSWTAHKDPEAVKEYFDPEDVVLEKVRLLAQWVKNSKHFTAFTGAGVSTSAGIPDFRGPTGVWTLRAQGKEPSTERSTTTLKAMPTATHMSLVQLQNTGYLKYLISQNTDGLHRRSGIPPEKLSELHGNSNLERCISCGKDYMRDFLAVSSYAGGVHDHKTGRACGSCGGDLHDTIINFDESLPEGPLTKGFQHAKASDLMLVLGSSLTVSPAKNMPEEVAKNSGKRLVIVNLQKTDLDSSAAMVIHAKTDLVMTLLMTELGLEILPFILGRRIKIDKKMDQLEVSGIDVDGTPATIIQGLQYKFNQNGSAVKTENLKIKLDPTTNQAIFIKVFFFGNYNETPIDLEIPFDQHNDFSIVYELGFNLQVGQWHIDGPFNFVANNNNNTVSELLDLLDTYGFPRKTFRLEASYVESPVVHWMGFRHQRQTRHSTASTVKSRENQTSGSTVQIDCPRHLSTLPRRFYCGKTSSNEPSVVH